jgi:hypothetical protein
MCFIRVVDDSIAENMGNVYNTLAYNAGFATL